MTRASESYTVSSRRQILRATTSAVAALAAPSWLEK